MGAKSFRRSRRRALACALGLALVLVTLGGLACSADTASGKTLLLDSADRMERVTSLSGTFEMSIDSDTGGFAMEGRYEMTTEAMYMQLDFNGQTVEELMYLPNIYIKVPGAEWRIVDVGSFGLNTEALKRMMEQKGLMDYASTARSAVEIEELEPEDIDGKSYRHIRGRVNLQEAIQENPGGLFDPAAIEGIGDVGGSATVDAWIDSDTSYPAKMTMDMSMTVANEDVQMNMAMTFDGFNEDVDIPQEPVDAKPISSLDADL